MRALTIIKGSCEPTHEYKMLTVTQYCVFWKLNATTFDEGRPEKQTSFPGRKTTTQQQQQQQQQQPCWATLELTSSLHPATAPPRICIINWVIFCYFNVDMRKKFTSE